ncbi:MAG: energy-coupling factor transporter ATPase [Clostridia bacterium]|nr:energy-coupling factor transporter ATPase [Clostridia bacterium]MBQ4098848.1 energy-coupling factor transporter ATPase [Clostridia bacterium]
MRIVAEKLSFTYNKKSKFKVDALKDVTLTIEEGSFFGIIGHTGSGKSTFIQHLNGLIPVEKGFLTVGDINLSDKKKIVRKRYKELRSKVGMVFQYPEYQLFAETVYEDVAFGFRNFFPDADKEEEKRAVFETLALLGLGSEYVNQSPLDLSGGQKRRVAIAGVLVAKPEILVLDEPVAGLDPVGKNELMKILHALHENGVVKTVIIVSHDMDEVCENCTEVAVFSEGEVVLSGSPKDVFKNTKLMNELRLGVPITGQLQDSLSEIGVEIDTDFSRDDFVEKVVEYFKNSK